MITLGKLEEVTDLRTVWAHEALDFTNWLADEKNIQLLANATGLDGITVEETESHVGNFRADILAVETNTSRKIIIENQLEETNHDHLGKLITYAAGKDAQIIIWLVKRACDEHRAAVEWLNNHTDDEVGFFLCEIKLYRIDGSKPAVKFDVIEKPNDWTKVLRKTESLGETEQQRLDYWTAFQDYAFKNESFAKNFNRRKATTDHWLSYSIGSSACYISVLQIRRDNALGAEINIRDDKDLFHSLLANKDAIESESGLRFDWRELPDKKASRIVIFKEVSFDDRKAWHKQFDWLIEILPKMKNTFAHYL